MVTFQRILGMFVSKGKDPMTTNEEIQDTGQGRQLIRKLDYSIWNNQ